MSAPEVRVEVKIIPAKRTASYDVPLESDRERPRLASAKVQANDVTVSTSWPGTGRSEGLARFPKTLEAADALIALAQAVRAELVEQGIES